MSTVFKNPRKHLLKDTKEPYRWIPYVSESDNNVKPSENKTFNKNYDSCADWKNGCNITDIIKNITIHKGYMSIAFNDPSMVLTVQIFRFDGMSVYYYWNVSEMLTIDISGYLKGAYTLCIDTIRWGKITKPLQI